MDNFWQRFRDLFVPLMLLLCGVGAISILDEEKRCYRKHEKSVYTFTTGCQVKYKHRWVSEEEYQRLMEREGT